MVDDEELYGSIFKRRSIRKYEAVGLDEGTLASIRSRTSLLRPLLPGIRTDIVLIGGGSMKGMFKVTSPHYLAIYSEEKDGYLVNAGFLLGQMDLYFNVIGIGCCWQGMLKPKERTKDGLKFVMMMGFGRPAEPLDRDRSDFKRSPLSSITDIDGEDELLEAARLAPSAMNKQSWFFKKAGNRIDVFYERSVVFDTLNQINSGIALLHLLLAAGHQGRIAEAAVLTDAETPKGYAYAASLSMGGP